MFDAINKVVTLDDRGVIKFFPGMDFKYNKEEHYWHITQGTYINDLCASTGLFPATAKADFYPETKHTWTSVNSTAQDAAERLRVNNYNPRSKAGSILWLIVCCRPDLMHSVKNPSQFLSDPGTLVVDGLQRIGCYLLGTVNEGIKLHGLTGSVDLHVASDADDAGGASRRITALHAVLHDLDRPGPGRRNKVRALHLLPVDKPLEHRYCKRLHGIRDLRDPRFDQRLHSDARLARGNQLA